MNKAVVVSVGLLLPGLLHAQGPQDYRCSLGDIQRRVEILYESAASAVPCEVHYYKDTEAAGERQVLWRAFNESGYCEAKTEAFIAQLEEAGFECLQGNAPAVSGEDKETDSEEAKE
ncbi:MAG: hypothetical protein AAF438_15830 [Pseudomonadota bacterium]